MDEIEHLQQAIAALEDQRPVLGDAVVETALASLRQKLATLRQPAQPAFEQRKLVTILFADLAGFTAMSERLDAEDVREILNDYFQRWSSAIQRHSGQVEKFIGDAVMAVFGMLTAREDDPENAIQAALEMRQELAALNRDLQAGHGVELTMRVGVHTGPVVVSTLGERAGQEFVVVGDAVNLTSRLQAAAPAGGILISHDTYRLVRGMFEVEALAPLQVKGKSEPVQAYLVLGSRPRAFRLSTRGVEGIETRLVGRETELQRLRELLPAVARERRARVVLLCGEAGVGKSRLMYEFDDRLDRRPQEISLFKGRTSSSQQSTAYSLLRDLFSSGFQILESDPPAVVQQKLERGLAEAREKPESAPSEISRDACEIGWLLGYQSTAPADSPCTELSGQDARHLHDRARVSLLDYLKALAQRRPLVFLLEDLHWADDSSLDTFEHLISQLARQPVLLVGAARPSFFERRPAWSNGEMAGKAVYERIDLRPLSQQEGRELIGDILQKVENLPESLLTLITDSAEGNPFYIEELIKMFIEEGVIRKGEQHWEVDTAQLAEARVPASLAEVLTARLDSLAPEERLALQRAAVIGRIFWDDAVEKLDDGPTEIRLPRILERLQSREMVNRQPGSAFDHMKEYAFKHALMRDVTYESLLRRIRKAYHEHAAHWLEAVTERSQRADEYAGAIADHYHLAEDHADAKKWYRRAALSAAGHFANPEALRCLSHCLEMAPAENLAERYELLKEREAVLSRIGERPAQAADLSALEELAARLGPAQQIEVALRRTGFCATTGDYPSAIHLAQKAIDLGEQVNDAGAQANGYNWSALIHWKMGEAASAIEEHEQALALAREANLAQIEAHALRGLGMIADSQGEYEQARRYLQQALDLYRQVGSPRYESMALNSLGAIAYRLGDIEAAQDYLDQALRFRQESGDLYAQGVTLANLGLVARRQGNLESTRVFFDESLALCQEVNDPEGEVAALNGLGNAALHGGAYDLARRHLEAGLAVSRQIGDLQGESVVLGGLAQLAVQEGQFGEARQYGLLALEAAEKTGGRNEQAIALLYLGDALLGLSEVDAANEAFKRSLAIRQSMGQDPALLESLAGAVRGALAASRLDLALEYVDEILQTEGNQPGGSSLIEQADDPYLIYVTCARALKQAGDSRLGEVAAQAHRLLMERANQIRDADQREAFLHNAPARQELEELYQELGRPTNE